MKIGRHFSQKWIFKVHSIENTEVSRLLSVEAQLLLLPQILQDPLYLKLGIAKNSGLNGSQIQPV